MAYEREISDGSILVVGKKSSSISSISRSNDYGTVMVKFFPMRTAPFIATKHTLHLSNQADEIGSSTNILVSLRSSVMLCLIFSTCASSTPPIPGQIDLYPTERQTLCRLFPSKVLAHSNGLSGLDSSRRPSNLCVQLSFHWRN